MANTEASKIEEILETLNHAISIHTKAAIQDLPFNKSELVKITDISNAANGEYKVWNGSAIYTAYSEKTDYEKGAQVYVTILNNDTSNRKLIIGLYQNSDNSIVNYKNSLSGYLPLTDNILDKQFEASIYDENGNLQRKEAKGNKLNGYENEISLLANYDGANGLGSREIDIYRCSDLFLVDNDEHFAGYKYMGISGNFKVDFRPYNVIKGDYGIKVYLKTLIKDDVLKTTVDKEFEYRLSVKEMLGSVYDAKTTYFPQGILINVANVAYIYDIKVSVFQDGGFKINKYVDEELENMPYNFYNEYSNSYQLLNNNIFIKDISVQFGNDIPDTDNLIEINSKNGLYYDSAQTDVLNQKNLYILWTHLNKNTGKFNKIQNPYAELNQHFQIHWFKKILYKPSEYIDLSISQWDEEDIKATLDAYKKWLEDMSDETKIAQLVQSYNLISGVDYFIVEQNNSIQLTSAGLEKVNNAKSAFEDTLEQMEYINLAGPLWEEILTGVLDDTSSFELNNFSPDIRKNETILKVIVEVGPVDSETNKFLTKDFDYKLLESEEFTLLNTRDVSNAISDDIANALKITCLDNSQGKYFIYNDTTGELLNRSDVSRIREWGISCISPITGEDYLSGNETILWKIPKNDTMIVFNKKMIDDINDGDFLEENNEIFSIINESYDDDFYYIRRNTDVINWQAVLNDDDSYNIQNGDWDISNQEDEIEEITDPDYLLKLNNENVTIVDDTFYQRIAYSLERYYIKSKTNNTITCYVIKNNVVFKDSLNLEFGQHSTSGSDYLFTIGLGSKIIKEYGKWISVGPIQPALTLNDDEYCEIVFDLYNSKNEKIDLTNSQKNDIIKLWVNGTAEEKGFYSGFNKKDNLDFTVSEDGNRVAVKVNESATIDDVSGIILQAELTQDIEDNTIVFKQYLPLHIRENDDLELDGTDYIVYDDKGANPSCFNDVYKLNNKEEYSFEIVIDDSNLKKDDNNESLPDPIEFYPKIDEKNKLLPNPIYVEDLSKNIYIRASKGEDQNKEIYYSFPLLIIKNKYNIPAYNEWVNSTPINGGVEITGASVAAGHRDETGSLFTGFVIGDVCKTAEEVVTTGLFAYNEGTQTFGLDTEGKLVLGAQDEGQITMNGSSGLIQSAANIGDEDSGVRIDLKNSRIDVYGKDGDEEINFSHISLNSKSEENNKNDPYFLVTNKGGINLIYVNDNDYYLQSANYDEKNDIGIAGTKIDLQNGKFFTNDGTFNGNITATSGKIGNWNINLGTLQAEVEDVSNNKIHRIVISPDFISGGIVSNDNSINGWVIKSDGTSSFGTSTTFKLNEGDNPRTLNDLLNDINLTAYGITHENQDGENTLNFSTNVNINNGKKLTIIDNNDPSNPITYDVASNLTDIMSVIGEKDDESDTRTIFGTTNSLASEIASIHAQIDGSEDENNPDIMDRLDALENLINDPVNGILVKLNDILTRLTTLENN